MSLEDDTLIRQVANADGGDQVPHGYPSVVVMALCRKIVELEDRIDYLDRGDPT